MRSARSIISSRRVSPMTCGSVLPLCNLRPARQERTGAGACAAIRNFQSGKGNLGGLLINYLQPLPSLSPAHHGSTTGAVVIDASQLLPPLSSGGVAIE